MSSTVPLKDSVDGKGEQNISALSRTIERDNIKRILFFVCLKGT